VSRLVGSEMCIRDSNGWIYLEAPKKWNDAELSAQGLQTYRYLKAGNVHAHLLQRIA
jgi:16S rRNA (guanine966-N2)-methyltransferase